MTDVENDRQELDGQDYEHVPAPVDVADDADRRPWELPADRHTVVAPWSDRLEVSLRSDG